MTATVHITRVMRAGRWWYLDYRNDESGDVMMEDKAFSRLYENHTGRRLRRDLRRGERYISEQLEGSELTFL